MLNDRALLTFCGILAAIAVFAAGQIFAAGVGVRAMGGTEPVTPDTLFGVASVIAMLAIGKGAEQEILEQMRLLGSNNILVTPLEEQAGGTRT